MILYEYQPHHVLLGRILDQFRSICPLDKGTNRDLIRRNEDDKEFYFSQINLVICHNP